MLDYVVYSALLTDLTDWRCEGTIYRAEQDPERCAEAPYLYAPDVVCGSDGRYYLYYAMAGDRFTSPIHVAVCDSPSGEYEYYGWVRNPDGSPYTRCITFDPAVINDGGVIRLYYGWALSTEKPMPDVRGNDPIAQATRQKLLQVQMAMFEKSEEEILSEPCGIMGANVVTLAADMLTVISEPMRIVPGQFDATGTSFEGHAFFEASSIRKIGDTYYFIYSSQWNHELCYATSLYPDRDFVFRGTIISNGDIGYRGRKPHDRLNATGNNHGSIECINGKWYVFYHRQTHKSLYSRQACAEPIRILPDGSIPQVEMTSCGLNGGPLETSGAYSAILACNLTNNNMPHLINGVWPENIPCITHQGAQRFVGSIGDGTDLRYKYFRFDGDTRLTVETRGQGEGDLLCFAGEKQVASIPVLPGEKWHLSECRFSEMGVFSLTLRFCGRGTIDLMTIRFS